MKNYIPKDFFEKNKKTVYSTEEVCIKKEGSAVGFKPLEIDLSVSTIKNGKVIFSKEKKDESNKKNEIENLYLSLKVEVKGEMNSIFGLISEKKLSEKIALWEAMEKRPLNYVDKSIGFDTIEKVKIYAEEWLKKADKYALFILKSKAKFKEEKNKITGAV